MRLTDEMQEVYAVRAREDLRNQDAKQQSIREQGLELAVRKRQCRNCPFGPNRAEYVTDGVMAEVQQRIASGEQWVCHATCGPGGSIQENTQYCAGAPEPGNGE